eukprot:239226-Hanusia_phi.AAC.1
MNRSHPYHRWLHPPPQSTRARSLFADVSGSRGKKPDPAGPGGSNRALREPRVQPNCCIPEAESRAATMLLSVGKNKDEIIAASQHRELI